MQGTGLYTRGTGADKLFAHEYDMILVSFDKSV
jgi:hypothetical protein